MFFFLNQVGLVVTLLGLSRGWLSFYLELVRFSCHLSSFFSVLPLPEFPDCPLICSLAYFKAFFLSTCSTAW